jgi:hypothetical protein
MAKSSSSIRVAVLWEKAPTGGTVEIVNGRLAALRAGGAQARAAGNRFAAAARLEIAVAEARVAPGANPTMVRIKTRLNPFTFFLRDVQVDFPIYMPDYGVAVIPANDRRSFAEIAAAVQAKGLVAQHQAFEAEPEETFENACKQNRNLMCPTWLGLSRDMRFFDIGYSPRMGYWGYVQPRYHSTLQSAPELDNKPYCLGFVIGPGASCRFDITRRLEEGVLPILRSTQREDAVAYNLTAFCTLETQPVSLNNLRGSEWQACYPNTGGNMLKEEDRDKIKDLMEAEMRGRKEETVCWVRVEAVNSGQAPRYAWFKALQLQWPEGSAWHPMKPTKYDAATGFHALETGRVFGINRLNGKAASEEEIAVLLQPGETAVYDMLIPHQPISRARALKLARQDYERHLAACRAFWRAKLASGAALSVPEPAIDERIKAGLLHCDIAALGREPSGSVLATIGWYSPIGSESSPIIQFFDSMGWHKLAERALQFFLDRQRADGFIQNFGGYQLETGPALWSMGEHYRYTRDEAWVRRIKPKLLKACEYLLAWRNRNKRPDLRGKGYGLLDGKVADPEDFFHSFMLNGLSYLGLQRVAEMLAKVDPAQSRRLAAEAKAFRADIRTAYYEALSRSPAIPLDDGTWIPTAPPWAEYPGPLALYAEGGKWFTHGAFGARDGLIGSLYLVISEVLEPHELGAEFLLKMHQQLFTVRNAGLTQPYYCRHDHIHLARGEVKPFLKTYFNQFSALQDRETYTFWEHYFHASQHKTHEEGWFLMQTRWMLWMERGQTLTLLRAIPRRWLGQGQRIELQNVATYFGPVSLAVESRIAEGRIAAAVTCGNKRPPRTIVIRLPHPEGRKAVAVEGGSYDPATETVTVKKVGGVMRVALRF